jgi:hypothetical protein
MITDAVDIPTPHVYALAYRALWVTVTSFLGITLKKLVHWTKQRNRSLFSIYFQFIPFSLKSPSRLIDSLLVTLYSVQ